MGKRKKLIATAICAIMLLEPLGTYSTLISYAAEEQVEVGVEIATLGDAVSAVEDVTTEEDMCEETTDATEISIEDFNLMQAASDVAIDAVNFPDETFRTYVQGFDKDSDGYLSEEEISEVRSIVVSGQNIDSLQGIEFFTELTVLTCDNNNLSSLDLSENTALTYVCCRNNSLKSLNVSRNTALTDLYCQSNYLSSLDVSNNTDMIRLYCDGNYLTSLDVSNNAVLEELVCGFNELSSLDVHSNILLTCLRCEYNNINNLDVRNNTELTGLFCNYNNLRSLDVSKNTALVWFWCNDNNLSHLDVSNNTTLIELYCDSNTYPITLSAGNQFDMSTLPGMDVSKVSNVIGGTLSGSILTVNAGVTDVTYTYDCGNGYSETFTLQSNMTTIPLSGAAISLDGTSYTYTGVAITPAVEVTYSGKVLVSGTDYTVAYSNNVNSGTATVTVTGKGNYTGTVSKTFTIAKASQTITATSSASSLVIGKTAKITAKTSGNGAITYKSGNTSVAKVDSTTGKITAVAAGTANITVSAAATANYNAGTKTIIIKVVPAATKISSLTNTTKGITIKWSKVTGAGGYYIYRSKNGGSYSKVKTITGGSTVSYTDTKATTNGAKYQYKIIAYKTVSGTTYKSAYSATKTTYGLSAPTIKSLTNTSTKKLTVTWGKNSKATGYQIQYSTSSSFASSKTTTKTVTSAATVKKVLSGLTKKKTYYVRIRAYKTVSGTKYYSAWSSKKAKKITK